MEKTEGEAQGKADRREELTSAAFHTIAQKGFEGLRVREVAAQVGINGATLHHYFPTKEDLIRSVVEYSVTRLRTTMMAATTGQTPAEQLHDHISRLYRLMQEEPELFIVLTEINLRARRTPVLEYLMEQNRIWHRMLATILQEGIERRSWPSTLDADAAAATIITLMEGASFWAATEPEWGTQAVAQLESWLGIA